jgi:hypothetical protein
MVLPTRARLLNYLVQNLDDTGRFSLLIPLRMRQPPNGAIRKGSRQSELLFRTPPRWPGQRSSRTGVASVFTSCSRDRNTDIHRVRSRPGHRAGACGLRCRRRSASERCSSTGPRMRITRPPSASTLYARSSSARLYPCRRPGMNSIGRASETMLKLCTLTQRRR